MRIINLGSSSSGNAFILESESGRMLLECGFEYKKLLEKADYDLPKHCLLTHEHKDHSKAAEKYISWGNKLYTSPGTKEALKIDCETVEKLKPFEVEGFLIIPFDTEHDCADPLGYIIQDIKTKEALLFATDTYFIRYKFENITHILIECNFDREELSPDVDDKHLERVFESHMSLQDLVLMLRANDLSKVEEIYLCHMSNDNLDPEKARKAIIKTTGLPVYLCLKNGGIN